MAEPEVEEEVIEIDLAELKKLKVPELKRRLAEFGLETKGTKAELLARVDKYLHEQEEDLLEELGEEEEEQPEGDGQQPGGDGVEPGETDVQPETGEDTGQEPQGEVKPPTTETAIETKVTDEPSADVKVSQPEEVPAGVKPNKILTPGERMQARAQRFGANTSESAKKLARSQRFGMTSDNGYQGLGKRPLSDDDVDRMKKRAERFGTTVSPAMSKVDELERKKKRQERFGLSITELGQEDRKKRRGERFGTS